MSAASRVFDSEHPKKDSPKGKSSQLICYGKEIGICSIRPFTVLPNVNWKIYKVDNPEFDHLLPEWGLTNRTQSQFSIAGHQLNLQTDLYTDGDYGDKNETIFLIRNFGAIFRL